MKRNEGKQTKGGTSQRSVEDRLAQQQKPAAREQDRETAIGIGKVGRQGAETELVRTDMGMMALVIGGGEAVLGRDAQQALAPEQCHRHAGGSETAAEVATDHARADHGDPQRGIGAGHGGADVTTRTAARQAFAARGRAERARGGGRGA